MPVRLAHRNSPKDLLLENVGRWTSAGGPEEAFSAAEQELYGSNRIAEGKLPMCASICSTKALVAGDAEEVANVVRARSAARGSAAGSWGWGTAYPNN